MFNMSGHSIEVRGRLLQDAEDYPELPPSATVIVEGEDLASEIIIAFDNDQNVVYENRFISPIVKHFAHSMACAAVGIIDLENMFAEEEERKDERVRSGANN